MHLVESVMDSEKWRYPESGIGWKMTLGLYAYPYDEMQKYEVFLPKIMTKGAFTNSPVICPVSYFPGEWFSEWVCNDPVSEWVITRWVSE